MIKIAFLPAALALIAFSAFAAQKQEVPALSIVAPNGQSSILIGSVHVGIAGLYEPDVSVFNGVKRVVFEHYGKLSQENNGTDASPAMAPWAKSLSQDEIAAYLQRTRCANLDKNVALSLLFLRSVQMANQFAYTICDQTPVESRDQWAMKAKPTNVAVDVLEDDAWVEAQRRLIPSQVSERGFKWILDHDPKTVLQGIKDALNTGDYNSLREQVDASFGSRDGAVTMTQIMVDGRNAKWMSTLLGYLEDGHALIIVGADHLPGPNGLIALLRKNGCTVKPTMLQGNL